MARRPTAKATRGARAAVVPTPIRSIQPSPLSSAHPSAYPSEAEFDPNDDEVSQIPMDSLTLEDGTPAKSPSKLKAKQPKPKPFRFLDLPPELRIRIYHYHFADTPSVIDLDNDNYKRIHKKLAILRTCRTIYGEAAHVFYSIRCFRVFPTSGRFFKTKKPLMARMNSKQRACITTLELRLGPGWSKPPRSWVVNDALGLKDCVNVRNLTVFVECDPSDSSFNGFRREEGFYEGFCQGLLSEVLAQMPLISRVQFDAWPSVKKSGAMMRGLIQSAQSYGKMICWGPERGWTDTDDGEDETYDKSVITATTLLNGAGLDVTIMA